MLQGLTCGGPAGRLAAGGAGGGFPWAARAAWARAGGGSAPHVRGGRREPRRSSGGGWEGGARGGVGRGRPARTTPAPCARPRPADENRRRASSGGQEVA